MNDATLLLIATLTLYSTGHWIGGTVSLVWMALIMFDNLRKGL
jgi:hypothetical protein